MLVLTVCSINDAHYVFDSLHLALAARGGLQRVTKGGALVLATHLVKNLLHELVPGRSLACLALTALHVLILALALTALHVLILALALATLHVHVVLARLTLTTRHSASSSHIVLLR